MSHVTFDLIQIKWPPTLRTFKHSYNSSYIINFVLSRSHEGTVTQDVKTFTYLEWILPQRFGHMWDTSDETPCLSTKFSPTSKDYYIMWTDHFHFHELRPYDKVFLALLDGEAGVGG